MRPSQSSSSAKLESDSASESDTSESVWANTAFTWYDTESAP